MAGVKSLVKDTAIYGLSSIIGRFLNWCLVPMYTNLFPSSEYGQVTYIYSIVALVLIILTYGMETGFFRFANHDRWTDPMAVYSTALISLASTSTLFIILTCSFAGGIATALECPGHASYITMMSVAVAIDAFTALPFSYLRYVKKAVRFATLKLINIGLNIGLNLFFLLLCPWLMKVAPGSVEWFYNPSFGIGYIFLANLISSGVTLVMLIPELTGFRYRFVGKLWCEMIVYSFPLLVIGIAGIMNQTIDKLIYPWLAPDKATAMADLGIYGANYKIAIIMVMFIQAFRFAYEPFIFAQNKEKGENKLQAYSDAMKFFLIFGLLIFLGVMFYLNIIKYFIAPSYFSGLKVVPVIMIAELLFGIFFNLSLWYKLTDKTVWGTWFSLLGLAVTILINILLVPRFNYMGCALAALGCYLVMTVASYLVGRAKYPIPYDLRSMLLYTVVAAALYGISLIAVTPWEVVDYAIRTILLVLYITFIIRREKINILPFRR
ncbi:MAG: oligosaccharide flippase family protein [Bacteroidales bacterium]|nr:oligosaccharide flippase family protein [Bacteroidales bacterium]